MKKDYKLNKTEDYELLDDICNILDEKRGIVLLEPMSSNRRERLHSMIKEYPNLKMHTVLEGVDTRVYFRRSTLRTNKSYVEYKREGDKAFQEGNYEESIEIFKDTIERFGYVDHHTYEMIGLANLKLGNDLEAADYLIVATYTASLVDDKKAKDYSPVINKILGINNRKSYMKKNYEEDKFYSKEFRMNENYDYNIKNINEIREYAALNRISFEEASNHFGLTNEQKDLAKLIIAREFYKDGNFEQGNKFLNNVAETKGKTARVQDFMEEIREKKEFYRYRADQKVKTLSYVKPGKRFYN